MNDPSASDASPRPYTVRKATVAGPAANPSTAITSSTPACTSGRTLIPPPAVTATTASAATRPAAAAQPTGTHPLSTVNTMKGTNPRTSLTGFMHPAWTPPSPARLVTMTSSRPVPLRRRAAARPEELRELVAARGGGLGVDVGQVEPDRAARDEQRVRDLRIAQALQQQGRDLALAIGQRSERVVPGRLGSGLGQQRRDVRSGLQRVQRELRAAARLRRIGMALLGCGVCGVGPEEGFEGG